MFEDKDIAICVRDVSKVYKLFADEKARLRSFFFPHVPYTEKRAVNDVSFVIHKGESVALFGRNGAGKSTILKMIAGVSTPSQGFVRVNGRVSALLDLSAGFDQEMTGRENIYFRSDVLGIPRKEMALREDEIIDFAELGDYINQPVRTYSSGMRARLGFAINVNVAPDIIIVDEALSVGDQEFREKCNEKIKEILKQDVTFLFVTHSVASAKSFCKRGLVLRNGRLVYDGDIESAVEQYDGLLRLGR